MKHSKLISLLTAGYGAFALAKPRHLATKHTDLAAVDGFIAALSRRARTWTSSSTTPVSPRVGRWKTCPSMRWSACSGSTSSPPCTSPSSCSRPCARGYGRVVMVGSMLASFPLAYRSSYVATKAAIRGFATAARFKMAPFGVWLTTVEPGSINTGISERRTKYIAENSPHQKAFQKMLGILDHNEKDGIEADRVARTILRAIEADEPGELYAVGSNAPAVLALRRALPRSVVETVIARKLGLSAEPVEKA